MSPRQTRRWMDGWMGMDFLFFDSAPCLILTEMINRLGTGMRDAALGKGFESELKSQKWNKIRAKAAEGWMVDWYRWFALSFEGGSGVGIRDLGLIIVESWNKERTTNKKSGRSGERMILILTSSSHPLDKFAFSHSMCESSRILHVIDASWAVWKKNRKNESSWESLLLAPFLISLAGVGHGRTRTKESSLPGPGS